MTGWAVIEEGGVSAVRTHGTRQLAVLATVAACLAAAVLLFGGTVAGLAVPGAGLALLASAWVLVVLTLVTGWLPGLYLGFFLLGVGAALPSTELSWGRATVLGITIGLVHEAARFSIDTRKPTRLGASLLRRMSLGAALATATVAIVTPILRRVLTTDPSVLWIPAAFAALAIPLVVPWLVDRYPGRLPRGRTAATGDTVVRSALAVVLAVAITLAVALGAQHQAASRAAAAGRPPEVAEVTTPQPEPLYPESTTADYIGAAIGLLVAAAILGLLYGAFHRRQLIVEESIEIELDDSVFAFSLPDRAELDEVALDRRDAAAMLGDLLVDLDSEPDPGRAVRFAYARVEQQLESRGAGRRESETVHEALARLLPRLDDDRAMRDLTTVFERARFSGAPVGESARATARDAILALRVQLDALAIDDDPAGRHDSADGRSDR